MIGALLHVTNGDAAAELLRDSGLPGEVAVSADVLHEGPCPAGVAPERWRKVRARYLAESGYGDYDECLAQLTAWDHEVERLAEFEEVVLWFEHDLFDQLLLIRLLDLFATLPASRTRISLLSVGTFPGVERFVGLGQLTPGHLASLFPHRGPLTPEQTALARAAWKAFRSPDPRAIEELLRGSSPDALGLSSLPHLAGALERHLEEFPSVRDGLSRTERQALAAVAAGAGSFLEVFRAIQGAEERAYLGDLPFHRQLRELARGPRPLLRLEPNPGGSLRNLRLQVTPTGRAVLFGEDDWVRIQGIDRWLGGVHLQGAESPWRWDPESRRLVGGPVPRRALGVRAGTGD